MTYFYLLFSIFTKLIMQLQCHNTKLFIKQKKNVLKSFLMGFQHLVLIQIHPICLTLLHKINPKILNWLQTFGAYIFLHLVHKYHQNIPLLNLPAVVKIIRHNQSTSSENVIAWLVLWTSPLMDLHRR